MTSTTARRSAKVAAQKQAAKQKRQVYIVAGLCVLLVVMLGLELPKILKSSSGPRRAGAGDARGGPDGRGTDGNAEVFGSVARGAQAAAA